MGASRPGSTHHTAQPRNTHFVSVSSSSRPRSQPSNCPRKALSSRENLMISLSRGSQLQSWGQHPT